MPRSTRPTSHDDHPLRPYLERIQAAYETAVLSACEAGLTVLQGLDRRAGAEEPEWLRLRYSELIQQSARDLNSRSVQAYQQGAYAAALRAVGAAIDRLAASHFTDPVHRDRRPFLALATNGYVERYPIEPCIKRTFPPIRRQLDIRLHEGLLDNVLGLFA